MTARPCAQCGDIIATGTYCTECKPKPAATTKVRPKGHVHTNTTRWKRLSDKARKLQPWCVDCGAHDDLTGDHIIPVSEDPTLAYEVLNIAVRCRTCNSRRGNRCTDEERQAVLTPASAQGAPGQVLRLRRRNRRSCTVSGVRDGPYRDDPPPFGQGAVGVTHP